MHSWLPNDENCPPIIRSIRKFVEERTSPAKDLPTEDLRDMKGIFSSLSLDDETSNRPVTAKGNGQCEEVTVLSGQEWTPGNTVQMGGFGEGEAYQPDFDNRYSYWGARSKQIP
jgi:hypothetical protein